MSTTVDSSLTAGTVGSSASAGPIHDAPGKKQGKSTTKYKIRFDSVNMLFDPNYPADLSTVLPPEEYESILRKLNTDLNQAIVATYARLHSSTTAMLASSVVTLGIFLTPWVWVRTVKHQHAMEAFWSAVRDFLADANKKSFLRRGLEWKCVEDRARTRGRDCYNAVYCYRIELLWRKNVVKSKKALAREAALAPSVSSPTSGSGSAAGVAKAGESTKRHSKLRPVSNIESVAEVPSDQEAPEPAASPGESTAAAAVAVGGAGAVVAAKKTDAGSETDEAESELLFRSTRPESGIMAPSQRPVSQTSMPSSIGDTPSELDEFAGEAPHLVLDSDSE